jgi:hypothetical protein
VICSASYNFFVESEQNCLKVLLSGRLTDWLPGKHKKQTPGWQPNGISKDAIRSLHGLFHLLID